MSQKFFKTKAGVSTPAVTFTNAANANLQVSYLESNTLSFSGTSGQLFSVTDSMSGIIFGVNDVSGVPSIEVLDTGVVRLAETFGNVLIGTSTDNGSKLQVTGNISVTGTVDGRDVSVDGTKLDGIEAGATADMTATEILNAIKTVDGVGSGLDADLLDGLATTSAATASTIVARDASGNFAANMITGNITGNAGTVTNGIYTTNAPLYDRGALASTDDWNTFTSAGIYQVAGASIGTNGPSGAYAYGQLVVTTNSNTVTQTYTAHASPVQVWVRIKYNASDWQPWILKLNSGNFTSYAPSLTGAGATGTWGINVTGQSRSVKTSGYGDTEFTFHQLSTPFAGYTDGWASYLISNHGAGASYYNQTLIMPFDGVPKYSRMSAGVQSNVFSLLSQENFNNYSPSLTGSGASGTWNINVTGNASTASTWQTPRNLSIGNTSKAINGSADVSWSVDEIGAEVIQPDGVPRNNLGDPTVREMALFDGQFSNKTDLYPINSIFVETSTDNVTWTNLVISDSDKRRLVGGDNVFSGLTIPYGTAYYRIRLRAATDYVFLDSLYMYWSGNGHSTKVQIFKKHDSGPWTQHTNSDVLVSSWPGHLYLPFGTIPWNPSAALGSHWHEVYVLFIPTWNSSFTSNPINLSKMQWWGGYPFGRRNLYSTSEFGDASFPAALSTVGNITQNGNQVLNAGNYTSYAPSLTGAGASGNWGINVTGSAAKLTTGRTIALTGDVTYNSGAFDGSANVTATATLTSVGTAGTYTKVTTDAKGRVTSGTTLSASDIPSLDASKITSGTIDAARLPSYVDDVIEAANLASFPATGETGKIYVALDTNKPYRWSGSAYIFITSGAVDSVAGKTGVVTLVKGDVGLGNVDNTSDASKNVLSAINVTGVVAVANGGTGSNTQAGARTNLGLGTIATQNSVDYLNKTETYNAGHAPEGKNLANAVLLNDFANARLRGSVFTLTNLSLSNAQIDGLFDGKGTYLALTPSSLTFPVVIEFTLPRTLSYGASVGLSFGNTSWITRGVKIESFTEGAWVTRLDTATNAAADIVVTMNGAGVGTTAVRYTFSDPVGTASGSFRLLHLWGYNYNSDMWSQVLMAKSGGSFYGDVTVPTLTATSGITNAGTLALSASGANIITASTNGLERIRIDASGNLGIGINTPTSPMHISGAATSNGVAYVFDSAAAAYTAPVGIKLSKAGTLSAQVSPTLEFEVGSGGGQARLYTTRLAGAGGNLIIETDNTSGTSVERVRVTSGGQVGIGASAPTNKLHVTDTSTSASTVLHVLRVERETNQIPQNGIGVGIQFSTETDNSSAYRVGSTIESVATDVTLNSEDFDLTFNTMTAGAAASEKVRISSLGHLGIGTNNPSERLHVVGNISVTGTVDGRDVSVDGTKLDGIAAGATANLGTVTSVSGTGSYNGLTLSGTVTGSGSLTLGGTPTGTWPISVSGNAATVSGFRNIGTIAVQAVSGSEVSCTTAQFVTWYTNNYSFLSYGYTVAKCSWDYAGNNNISDTVIGTLELAGCTIETFSDGTQYTIRVTRPTTGEGSGTVLVYNNQGGLYNPGWRVLLDNTNISSYAPTLTGAGSSGTWPISITGSAASATTAGQIDGIEFRNGNSSNPVGPDTINDNGIGYITGVSLFGQNDGALYSQAYSSSWVHQIYGDYRTGQLAVRGRNNSTLTSWRAVLDSSNYSSYALPLSGGTVTGDLTVTGNLNNSSDAALKTNITTINNALDTVDQLRGVEFDWKDTGKHSIGVIAQEVEQVLPDLVTDLENGTKAVAYANLVGVLIEAIKELRKEVEELKNK